MLLRTRPLTDVKGIGEATAANLVGVGIDSAEALAAASSEEICACPGFGLARADAVQQAAHALLVPSTKVEQATAAPAPGTRVIEKHVMKAAPPKSKKENPKMAKKKTTSKKKTKKADKKKKSAEQKKTKVKKDKKGKKGKKDKKGKKGKKK